MPTEKQIEGLRMLTNPDLPYICFHGGARSGKTKDIAHFMLNRMVQFPRSKQLVSRLRLVDLRRSAWLTFQEHARDHYPRKWFTFKEKACECHCPNGAFIVFTGLDTKERIDFILGTEWLTMFVNEVTQITYDAMTTIMTRLSQKVAHAEDAKVEGMPKLLVDCNPKHRKHWVYQLAVQKPSVIPYSDPPKPYPPNLPQWTSLNWSPFDNAQHLPASFFHTLEALPEIKRRRMKDGEWCDNENAVYDEFDEDIHVINPFTIPVSWKRVRGIDFGFRNAFVCLWAAVNHDGDIFFYDEHFLRETIVQDHAKYIAEKSQGDSYEWTVADWDAEDRETLHRCGIKTSQAEKDILPGIEAVKRRLRVRANGKASLFVFRGTCPNLVTEFYDYIWDLNAPLNQKKKEIPVDYSNDTMDTLRYMVMRLDSGPKTSQFVGIRSERERTQELIGF